MSAGRDTTNVNYCIQIYKHNASTDIRTMCIASICPSLSLCKTYQMWYFSTMVNLQD